MEFVRFGISGSENPKEDPYTCECKKMELVKSHKVKPRTSRWVEKYIGTKHNHSNSYLELFPGQILIRNDDETTTSSLTTSL